MLARFRMVRTKNVWLRRFWQIGARLVAIFIIAFIVGWLLNRIEAAMERSAQPAGFARGLVQGALMPMAMPNLFVGHDISIYSLNNTGITYKLGYTAGVNICGAIFFGLTFWRVSKLRAIARNGGASIEALKAERVKAVER